MVWVGLCFSFNVQEPPAQLAFVLVLKPLGTRGFGLKYDPTDKNNNLFLWPCSLAVPVLAGWVYAFCGSCPGTPEGSTGSGSGFKVSQQFTIPRIFNRQMALYRLNNYNFSNISEVTEMTPFFSFR